MDLIYDRNRRRRPPRSRFGLITFPHLLTSLTLSLSLSLSVFSYLSLFPVYKTGDTRMSSIKGSISHPHLGHTTNGGSGGGGGGGASVRHHPLALVGPLLGAGAGTMVAGSKHRGHTRDRVSTTLCDQGTQTPDSIERETRRQKFCSFRIHLNSVPTPAINFNLKFLGSKKRTNLSANAVATEQKATKVSHRARLTAPSALLADPLFVVPQRVTPLDATDPRSRKS